ALLHRTLGAGLRSAYGAGQCAGLSGLRRSAPAPGVGDPALPAQHPPPAALPDAQPRCAGERAAVVYRSRLSLGAATHPPTGADLPSRVSLLRRTARAAASGAAIGDAAGIRAAAAGQAGAPAGLGQSAQSGAAAAA